MKQTSITSTILWVMLILIILSSGMALFAITNLVCRLNDTKAINTASSLRMQSYQLLGSANKFNHIPTSIIDKFDKILHSKNIKKSLTGLTSNNLKQQYKLIIESWLKLKNDINKNNNINLAILTPQINHFSDYIDTLILTMEHNSTLKLKLLATSQVIVLAFMLLIAFLTVKYTKLKVVTPLLQMVESANAIAKGQFEVKMPQTNYIELASLGTALQKTAKELSILYSELELQVKEKTLALTQAHDELTFLHHSLLILHTKPLNKRLLKNVLIHLQKYQKLKNIRLVLQENNGELKEITINSGWPSEVKFSEKFKLKFEHRHLGFIEVISDKKLNVNLFEYFTMMLARSIIIRNGVAHKQKLALMEERSIIARELHDSLGQLLSFLKIQISLLKKSLLAENENIKVEAQIDEINNGINTAYQQLRELLATFRLTIKEPNLKAAIKAMLVQLKAQTNIPIHLDYQLAPQLLQANQHIHILQLIREATLNAIKHAKATRINIYCKTLKNGMLQIDIRDDGIGLAHLKEKQQHFGIGIMHERANKLAGTVEFNSNAEGGTSVSLSFPPLEIS